MKQSLGFEVLERLKSEKFFCDADFSPQNYIPSDASRILHFQLNSGCVNPHHAHGSLLS
jgi:hypothetical protein